MIDPTSTDGTPVNRISSPLEANLALLPAATQQALRAATAQPATSLHGHGAQLRASVKTDDGRWVPVHSSDDPLAASARVAERFAASNPPLVIVVGLGLGYLLDALESTTATTRVLAIEPMPAITRAMLTRRDWKAWLSSGRLTILTGPDYTGSAEVWGLFGRGAATPPIIMAPMLEREFPEEALRARALATQVIAGALANEHARRQFAGRYLLNTLANIPVVAKEGDSASLFGAFSRVPAIVVGAGPSLDRNIRELQKMEGRVLLIAVDTALRPLLAAGIVPQIVVSVDPSELNARHLRNIADRRGSWLVAEASIDPAVFPSYAGRTFTFNVSQHQPWPWLSAHGLGRGTLRAWGSVLTTAFDLAIRAGCDPIVFAGADLAYSGGLQYCRNTTYEDKWRDFPTDAARVELFKTYLAERPHLTQPDVHGGAVTTTPHFVQFRDWIVSRANEAADRRIVNATGGGILQGGRIAQTDFSVLHLPKAKHDLGLHRRLHSAWAAGLDQRRHAVAQLEHAITPSETRPMDAWLDFGGDTASRQQIDAAADHAAHEISRQARTAIALEAQAAHADAHAQSLAQAQAWIHPNYAFACEQAEGQQAHVLLNHLQRTHPLVAPANLRAIVDRATSRPGPLRALDIGCGLGRTMVPLATAGHHVDGVDISQAMIELAQQDPTLTASRFFVSDGDDCGAAPDGAYDIATLHLTLHLITSRSVRQSLLRSIARALRPGGTFFAQMPFYPDCTAATVPAPHLPWQADGLDRQAPSSGGHVWPTTDALPDIFSDFSEVFRDVQFQFVNFPEKTARHDGSLRPITHLLVSGSSADALAVRIYALPTSTPAKREAVLAFPGAQRHP